MATVAQEVRAGRLLRDKSRIYLNRFYSPRVSATTFLTDFPTATSTVLACASFLTSF